MGSGLANHCCCGGAIPEKYITYSDIHVYKYNKYNKKKKIQTERTMSSGSFTHMWMALPTSFH